MGTTKVKFIDDSSSETKKAPKPKKVKEVEVKEEEKLENQDLGEEKVEKETKKTKEKKAKTSKKDLPRQVKAGKKIRGKKYTQSKNLIDKERLYPLKEALELIKKATYSKFDGTVEAHFLLTSPDLRGLLKLPYPLPVKSKKVLVFTSKTASIEGRENIILGNEETIEKIKNGKLIAKKDFQKVIATPEFMPHLAKIAKTLGPAGLMPNPKSGTLVDDVEKGLKDLADGQTEYKTEPKAPIIHLGVGKVSQSEKELEENIQVVVKSIGQNKIKGLHLSPTMGPSIKIEITSLR